ncbi:hypothetical protein ACGFZU_06915 [Streptomyces tendae]|uniref:hypothetical protein n=1 Tax=Streptomyces tendae TaxID=1932 RepID=UPI00371E4A8B
MTGPACGNNPNHQLTDGDRQAVDSFRAYLATLASLRTAQHRLDQIRDAARLHRQQLVGTSELYAVIEADDAPPADQTALRDRIAEALAAYDLPYFDRRHQYEVADAVLAVLPAAPGGAEYDALVAEADRLRRDGAALHAKAVDVDTQLATLREQVVASAAPAAPRETAAAVLAVVEAALGDTLVPSARAEALAGITAVMPAVPAAVVPAPTDRRDRYATAIWERQNPGRRYTDCEYRWRADAEADADAVLVVADAEQADLRARVAELEQPAVTPPPALTEEGRLRARVQVLGEDAERNQGLAKVGARCMRDGHQGLIESGRAVIEGHRFALSVKLGLGTGASWEAIHERVAELEQQTTEAPLSPYYSHEACGFHWHGRDGMDIPVQEDGQPVCPRCELAKAEKKMAALQRRRDEVGAECKRRGKRVLEQSEQIIALKRQVDEVQRQLGAEILRAGQAEAELEQQTSRTAPASVSPHTLAFIAGHLDARAVATVRADSQTYTEWQTVADWLRRLADETTDTETEAVQPFVPPVHYRRDDGVDCCVHTIPVGPDSCRACRELADDEPAAGARQDGADRG